MDKVGNVNNEVSIVEHWIFESNYKKGTSVDNIIIESHILYLETSRNVFHVWNILLCIQIHQQHRKNKNWWLVHIFKSMVIYIPMLKNECYNKIILHVTCIYTLINKNEYHFYQWNKNYQESIITYSLLSSTLIFLSYSVLSLC